MTDVLESISDAFFALDRDWRFTYLNSAAERVLRRDRAGLIGRGIWDEFPEAVGLVVEREYRRAMNERVTTRFEFWFPPLDTWFDVRAYPTPTGISVYFQDINEQRRIADDLRRSEARYRSLATAATSIVWTTDPDGAIVEPSESWTAYTGQPREAYGGWGWLDAVHPDDRGRVADDWRAAVATRTACEFEYRLRRRDGEYRRVLAHGVPVLVEPDGGGGGGGAVREWVGTCVDVEDQRRVDDARRRSEFRFQRLIEQSSVSVQLFWPDGTIRQVNDAWTRLWGITPADIPGYSIRHDPKLAALGVAPLVERAFNGEAVTIEPIPYDAPAEGDHAGRVHWVGAYLYPVKNESGEIEEVVLLHNDMTAHKAAEQALADSERRLRSVFETAQDAILLADDDGRYTDANPAAVDMTGYARDELLRMTVRDLTRAPGGTVVPAAVVAEQWRGFIAAGRQGGEAVLRRKDGRHVVAEYRAVANVLPGLHLSVLRDVTERNRVESALRASEARFRFLGELGELTRDLTDPAAVMAAVTRATGTHTGATRCAYAEVAADGDAFTIRGDYAEPGAGSTVGAYSLAAFGARAAADQRGGRTLVVRDVDRELAPADGADTFNAIGIKAIVCCPLIKGGRLAAMMALHQREPRDWTAAEVSLLEAVVERSWAYIEQARVARALRRSESAFRQLADAMPQIVFAATPDGHVDYFNRRWYEYTGTPDGAVGYENWRHVHDPAELPRVTARWQASLESGEPYEIEYPLRRADGAFRWHLGRALPVRGDDGRIVRWFGTNTDIHDHKVLLGQNQRLLESERAARAEAERAGRIKDEFLATLSHELRTPLNAILGYAHLVRSGAADTPQEVAEAIDVIERNARAQTQIVEDLLDMSRIISGKLHLNVRPVRMAEVVEAAAASVRPAADARGVRLVTVLDPDAGPVAGDAGRLQQVVWNLLANSIKFTPRGGRVRATLARVASSVELTVSDSGQGIPPDFLPHVFERFRQADATTTRRHGGLGLGLSIVKQLVELHGGTIRAHSDGPGRGATFVVSLPVSAVTTDGDRGGPSGADGAETDAAETRAADPHAARAAVAGGPARSQRLAGVRVLVVDDDADARNLLTRVLRDGGARVTTVASAADALGVVAGGRAGVDVILSDIGMPDADGYDLIRSLRALPPDRGGTIPAAALTAFARSGDRTRALTAGYQMHIAKPVDPRELVATVASLAAMRVTPKREG